VPHFLSMATFLPRGPRVTLTAFAISGRTMPLEVISSLGLGLTTTRSPSGLECDCHRYLPAFRCRLAGDRQQFLERGQVPIDPVVTELQDQRLRQLEASEAIRFG
jgi:hypothetical protein